MHAYMHMLRIAVNAYAIGGGVTGICVSQGCVFPTHISLGMRVSPHTYH